MATTLPLPLVNLCGGLLLLFFAGLFFVPATRLTARTLQGMSLALALLTSYVTIEATLSGRPRPDLLNIPLPWLMAGYLISSVVTYFTYRYDKQSSKRDGWRISEMSLHSLALLGGWPGALLAQRRIPHKSSWQNKFIFRILTRLIALVHAGFWFWWWFIR